MFFLSRKDSSIYQICLELFPHRSMRFLIFHLSRSTFERTIHEVLAVLLGLTFIEAHRTSFYLFSLFSFCVCLSYVIHIHLHSFSTCILFIVLFWCHTQLSLCVTRPVWLLHGSYSRLNKIRFRCFGSSSVQISL